MCEHCGRTYIYLSELTRHQMRKVSCKRICDKCGYQFKRPEHLKRHLKNETACEKRIQKVHIEGDNNNVAINGNIYNNTNNITINAFGHENRDFMTDEVIEKVADYAALPAILFQLKNFDPEHPENHNIMMINKREKEVLVKRKKGWVRESLQDAHRNILNEQEFDIDIFYKNRPKNNDKKNRNLEKVLWLLEEYMNSESAKKDKDVENWLKRINSSLIDNKELVLQSFRQERDAIKSALKEASKQMKNKNKNTKTNRNDSYLDQEFVRKTLKEMSN